MKGTAMPTYNWIVITTLDDTVTGRFGPFDTCDEALIWVEAREVEWPDTHFEIDRLDSPVPA
jgi:hypothetical protein